MADQVKNWAVRQGGLMRCCLATLDEAMEARTMPPNDGDVIHCKYHADNDGMIFRAGAWEWNQPERKGHPR